MLSHAAAVKNSNRILNIVNKIDVDIVNSTISFTIHCSVNNKKTVAFHIRQYLNGAIIINKLQCELLSESVSLFLLLLRSNQIPF